MSATNVKLAPYTSQSEYPIASESAVAVTFVGRAAAPYPPGNVLINGAAFPSTTTSDVVMTWNHRYRQGPFVVAQNAGDVPGGPEGNYTIQITINGVVIRTVTGLTGNSYTYTRAQRLIDNSNVTYPTTITIIPVNGTLSGTPRNVTFLMTGFVGIFGAGRHEFAATTVGGLFL